MKKKPSAKITSRPNELTKSFASTHVSATTGGTLTYIPYTLTGLHPYIHAYMHACMHACMSTKPSQVDGRSSENLVPFFSFNFFWYSKLDWRRLLLKLYTASELATVKTAPAWVSIVRAFSPEGAELLDSYFEGLEDPEQWNREEENRVQPLKSTAGLLSSSCSKPKSRTNRALKSCLVQLSII